MEETPAASGHLNEFHRSNSLILHDDLLPFEQLWKIQAAMDPMSLASPNLNQSTEVVPSLITDVSRTPLAPPNLSQSCNQPGVSNEVVPKHISHVRRIPLTPLDLGQSNNQHGISSEVVPSPISNIRRIPLAPLNLGQSYNQPGISNEVVPSPISNVRRIPLASPNSGQRYNPPGRSGGVGPSQKRNVSRRLEFQSPNNSNDSVLERKNSNLSGPEPDLRKRAIDQVCRERCKNNSSLSESDLETDPAKIRKREIDKAYRERCKKQKTQNESDIKNLKGENNSLQKENDSLKHDNTQINQTSRDQAIEIDQLRSELEKKNVLVQTLSGLLADADPMRLEKLKAEIASLRKNANLPWLAVAEENANLRIENKELNVQNDGLCWEIIRARQQQAISSRNPWNSMS